MGKIKDFNNEKIEWTIGKFILLLVGTVVFSVCTILIIMTWVTEPEVTPESVQAEIGKLESEKVRLEYEIEELEEIKFLLWEEKDGLEATLTNLKIDADMVDYYVTLEYIYQGNTYIDGNGTIETTIQISKELFDNIKYNVDLTDVMEDYWSTEEVSGRNWEIYCIDKFVKEKK